jgi:hypothetical protein
LLIGLIGVSSEAAEAKTLKWSSTYPSIANPGAALIPSQDDGRCVAE